MNISQNSSEMSATPTYDFWKADGDIISDVFGTYNYGYNDFVYETPKKCTITEIIDDDFEDYFEQDDINVDDLSKAFDNVVEDWKIKMEVLKYSLQKIFSDTPNTYNPSIHFKLPARDCFK